jgi:outer membrane beta-barrel protein
LIAAGVLLFCLPSLAVIESVKPSQADYERSIGAVVRNKNFYKAGRLEAEVNAGVLPYDSTLTTYTAGARLAWHLSDHFGWEIADAAVAFPTVNSFTTNLVSAEGLSNLQTVQLRAYVGTNFLWSPIYGKVRFIGSSVVFFDVYTVAGFGAAKTDTLMFGTATKGGAVSQSTVHSGIDPMMTLGFGFKFFINNAMGLVVDLRDYLVYAPFYGIVALRSNYAVNVGVAFFIPTF